MRESNSGVEPVDVAVINENIQTVFTDRIYTDPCLVAPALLFVAYTSYQM